MKANRQIAGAASHSRGEVFHRQLVSGELTGWRAALGRLTLSLLSLGYQLAVGFRSLGFRWGILKSTRVSVPVISIGNLTTGGTGKTPFAAFVARWFRQHEIRVAFLSRGYGADPGAVNDEALVLNLLCPDVPHLQNPDRVASAETAIEELESQLLILDDGFQHRRLARDLDIVLIDATNPWGYDALLPRGFLREPLSALRRADVVVVTRVDQVTPPRMTEITNRLDKIRGTNACVQVSFPSRQLINSNSATCHWEQLTGSCQPKTHLAAFCGIGNPDSFHWLLEQKGISLTDANFRVFPDHHRYTRDDVESLKTWVAGLGVAAVVTTLKDLVKLELTELGTIPLWAAEITTEIHSGQELLESRFSAIQIEIPADDFEDWTSTPTGTL